MADSWELSTLFVSGVLEEKVKPVKLFPFVNFRGDAVNTMQLSQLLSWALYVFGILILSISSAASSTTRWQTAALTDLLRREDGTRESRASG